MSPAPALNGEEAHRVAEFEAAEYPAEVAAARCDCEADTIHLNDCPAYVAPAPAPGPDEQGAHEYQRGHAAESSPLCLVCGRSFMASVHRPAPAAPSTDHSGEVCALAENIGRALVSHVTAAADAINALAARRPATEAEEAIERVRQLHAPDRTEPIACDYCGDPYPCPTVRALAADGGDPA